MLQQEFDSLVALLKGNRDPLFQECYESLLKGTILFHNLGIFETVNVLGIMRDKANLDQLGIQKSNCEGLLELIKALQVYNSSKVYLIHFSTNACGFRIVLDEERRYIIGILKFFKSDYNKDVSYQLLLKERGYPSKNLFIFTNGLLKGEFFKLEEK